MTLFDMDSPDTDIFLNRDVLKDAYQPPEIVGRETEKKELNSALRPVINGTGSPDNVFVSGPTGTGKTALVRSAMNQLATDDQLGVTTASVNCRSVGGETELMLEIANRFRSHGNKLNTTGYSHNQARDRLFKELDKVNDTVLIVLDELDTIDDLNRILYHIPRAHEYGTDTDVGLIAISNEPDFLTGLDADVSSTLTDVHISFSEYDANDIRAVLRQRALLAFADTEVNDHGDVESEALAEDVIPYIAAKGAKHTGDARMARDVLRKAGDIAMTEGAEQVTTDHVDTAVDEYHRTRMVEAVRKMSTTAKSVVYSLLTLERDGIDEPRTKELYARYESLCEMGGMDPVGERQIQNTVKKLDRSGITNMEEHHGSGGNYHTHRLQYEHDAVADGVEDAIEMYGVHQSVTDLVDTDTADGEPATGD